MCKIHTWRLLKPTHYFVDFAVSSILTTAGTAAAGRGPLRHTGFNIETCAHGGFDVINFYGLDSVEKIFFNHKCQPPGIKHLIVFF